MPNDVADVATGFDMLINGKLVDGSRRLEVVAGLKDLIRDEAPSARDIVFDGLARAAGGLSRENWSLTQLGPTSTAGMPIA